MLYPQFKHTLHRNHNVRRQTVKTNEKNQEKRVRRTFSRFNCNNHQNQFII